MFRNAIVRTPSSSMIHGLTTSAHLGKPNYQLALNQHQNYINALAQCNLEITVLPPIEQFPDSCFVEDVAVLTETYALLTRPGASSRQGEVKEIESIIHCFFKHPNRITPPASLEGGDILQVGNHFFIGLSNRTNEEGAQQMMRSLSQQGYTASIIPLKEFFHLKTGVSYLGENTILVCGELINHPAFSTLKQIIIDPYEAYAANCIAVNGTVLIAQGYPKTKKAILDLGYPVIELDMSEFRKIDGGLSCLSLRF
ncbi:dimethylarginine dimethylaminohydrolase family protein [Legionella sp. km772]|uniref:dimethylarginine dimethylaminohydrolase family protein n=1 Tax=Legionella sp. km772 TaxID=2498111 RepID=UPI000F8EA3EB|nr:arginine deiminase family protein [Legionella sp. km772]RUR12492.1 N(G),N(G)-dimethylarginine dimethylaminohydrolase [Legionella sp. km772]